MIYNRIETRKYVSMSRTVLLQEHFAILVLHFNQKKVVIRHFGW